MESLPIAAARRLAVHRSGLLRGGDFGWPGRLRGAGPRSRRAAHLIVRHFGYLQLDSIAVAGARSHSIVLASRLPGFQPRFAETLLAPGEPLFEYWGHEASWLPLELYATLGFRRRAFGVHPWWGDVLRKHRQRADELLRRIADEGPMRSADFEGRGKGGWWGHDTIRKVAAALWSAGDLAVSQRAGFLRTFDLTERVIPSEHRSIVVELPEALRTLLLLALDGHGWAPTSTLIDTWRLSPHRRDVLEALAELENHGEILPCVVGKRRGWIRPRDLEAIDDLLRRRPRKDQGVLLSPFDPLLWDRRRVDELFGFHQVLEIYKPAAQRQYGYYCLPVLAGDRLVARVDLKADSRRKVLHCLRRTYEEDRPEHRAATDYAVARWAAQAQLQPILEEDC